MRVFISVASPDRPKAEELALALRGDGHVVFLDDHDLPVAQTYHERIRKAIAQADVVIFLISPTSVAPKRYTLSELKFVQDKWPHPKGRLIPVMVERTPMSAIPAYARAVTILFPRGNMAAEVNYEVSRLDKKMRWLPESSGGWFGTSGRSSAASSIGSSGVSPTFAFSVLLFLGLGLLAGLVNSFLAYAWSSSAPLMFSAFSRGLIFASVVVFALLYFDLGRFGTLLVACASTVAGFVLAHELAHEVPIKNELVVGAVRAGILVFGLSLVVPELRDKLRWGIVIAAGVLGAAAGSMLQMLGFDKALLSVSWEAIVAAALCYVISQVAASRSSRSWQSSGAH